MVKQKIIGKQELWGITQDMCISYCLSSDFPGTDKWPAIHPIWDSFLPSRKSPRDAWEDVDLLTLAVRNMYWILTKSIEENKYEDFVVSHKKAFETCMIDQGIIIDADISFLRKILTRFTVAKIAPKVTALKSSDMLKIIDDSGLDISCGVYLPMAGFGGIKESCEKWYNREKIPQKNGSWNYLIEAYDINQLFCEWYGWEQRDCLAQIITTDKMCFVCPPFGENYEHWKGTPDNMSDISYIDWHQLIKEHVKAKNYIFIGPEISTNKSGSNKDFDSNGNKRNGLFSKTSGIMLWSDEILEKFKDNIELQKQYKIKK